MRTPCGSGGQAGGSPWGGKCGRGIHQHVLYVFSTLHVSAVIMYCGNEMEHLNMRSPAHLHAHTVLTGTPGYLQCLPVCYSLCRI